MVGFHTGSLPSSCLFYPQYLQILLLDFGAHIVSVLYLKFFLVFGATLGVVPLIQEAIVDTFWLKHHLIG